MSFSILLSMSAFALAASISPGPVNLIGLSSGSRYPLMRGLIFVSGATLGFLVLFVAVGLGLNQLFELWPALFTILRWAGIGFLLYLSFLLARSDGELSTDHIKAPEFWTGVFMQWLNPKAWLASAAGISTYAPSGELQPLMIFTVLYGVICWLSLSSWVVAGAFFRETLHQPKYLKRFNRLLALLLFLSCIAALF
jgi:threonine/homoserine/homoserine lactone efflux protein